MTFNLFPLYVQVKLPGEVFLFNHFHSPGAVFLSSNEES